MNHAHRERKKENVSGARQTLRRRTGARSDDSVHPISLARSLARSPARPLAVTCARRRGNASRIGRRARRRRRDSAAMPNRPFRSRPFVRKEEGASTLAPWRSLGNLEDRSSACLQSSLLLLHTSSLPSPHVLTRCCVDPRPLPSHSKTSFCRVINSGIMISAALVAVVLALGACFSLSRCLAWKFSWICPR